MREIEQRGLQFPQLQARGAGVEGTRGLLGLSLAVGLEELERLRANPAAAAFLDPPHD